jgi:hypothetical protein
MYTRMAMFSEREYVRGRVDDNGVLLRNHSRVLVGIQIGKFNYCNTLWGPYVIPVSTVFDYVLHESTL